MIKRKILSKKITDCELKEVNTSSPVSPKLRYRLILVFFVLFSTAWLVYTGIYWALFDEENNNNLSGTVQNKQDMATASRAFVLNSTGKATGLVVFLHGLGDNGQGWSFAFDSKKQNHIRYVFPNAPIMPVTLNGRMKMPSWFDIIALDMSGEEDEQGILKAREDLRKYIEEERKQYQIPSNRVVLGGFSMGGALALYTGLTNPEPLAGMILLSTWLPLRKHFSERKDGATLTKQNCPIFQGHGMADPMVKLVYGSQTHEMLNNARKQAGQEEAIFKSYRGVGHSSSDEEMDDVFDFISKVLPAV